MDSVENLDHETTLAMLSWQVDLGVSEVISDEPINRYDAPAAAPGVEKPVESAAALQTAPQAAALVDPVEVARAQVSVSKDLAALHAALKEFELCELKRGARNTVFSDGQPGARVMIIGEAPGANEDREGKPFVGPAGQLLDAMFAAIDHGRDDAANPIYITNVMPWRPPQNREPTPEEIAMMLPFVERHVELAAPDVLVLMGNVSCLALMGRKGITRLRGNWVEVLGKPALPMFHPAYLLRNPAAKREAWHDLLMLQAKLRGAG